MNPKEIVKCLARCKMDFVNVNVELAGESYTQAEIDAIKAEAEAAKLAACQTLDWACSLTPGV